MDSNLFPTSLSVFSRPVSIHNMTSFSSASLTTSSAKSQPFSSDLSGIPILCKSVMICAFNSLAHSICSLHCRRPGLSWRERIATSIPSVAAARRCQFCLSYRHSCWPLMLGQNSIPKPRDRKSSHSASSESRCSRPQKTIDETTYLIRITTTPQRISGDRFV